MFPQVLINILSKLTESQPVSGEKVAAVSYTVQSEREDLDRLKVMLGTQGTLRPIFESRLKQKRSVREKAMVLRKKIAEAGINYEDLSSVYKEQKDEAKEVRFAICCWKGDFACTLLDIMIIIVVN